MRFGARPHFTVRQYLAVVLFTLLFLLAGCRLFLSYYTLDCEVENQTGGSISCVPDRKDYPENTIVELTADPDIGWELSRWTGVTSSDGNKASVLMDLNRNVTASFRPILKDDNPSDNLIAAPSSIGFAPSSDESWTFMVYLDADNSLDPYAIADFNEIERGFKQAGNPNLNIIVLIDRYQGGSFVYRIQADSSSGIDSLPLYPLIDGKQMSADVDIELNMGTPVVLTDFIKYCLTEQPAEHYALMFWNHGGGARSLPAEVSESVPESRLICADENPGDGSVVDYLFTDEVQQALNAVVSEAPLPGGFGVISMDACIMGTVEVAYELRNLSSCYVASMSNVAASGWNYEELFRLMTPGAGETSAEALSVLMVDTFKNVMSELPGQSISGVQTAGLNELKNSIDKLAAVLYREDKQGLIEYMRDAVVDFFNDDYDLEAIAQPYHDLNDLCWLLINNENYLSAMVSAAAVDVLDALGNTVLTAYAGVELGNYYGSGSVLKRGLSIFFSKGNLLSGTASQYAKQYWYTSLDCGDIGPMGYIDFCTSDEDGVVESWRELHEAWYDPYKPEGYTPGSW